MREFLRILTEAELHPLSREDLIDSQLSVVEPVGYWVNPAGKIYPVESLHFQTLGDLGITLREAFASGWIKVSTENDFTAEFVSGCVGQQAIRSLCELARQNPRSSYALEGRWDGAEEQVICLTESERDRLFDMSATQVFADVRDFSLSAMDFITDW